MAPGGGRISALVTGWKKNGYGFKYRDYRPLQLSGMMSTMQENRIFVQYSLVLDWRE